MGRVLDAIIGKQETAEFWFPIVLKMTERF